MKTLIVLRHAKSSWSNLTVSDHDRPLNGRGKRDAPRIGRILRDFDLTPDLIISSTAKRAQKTAMLVADSAEYHDEIVFTRDFYHASPAAYIAHLQALPDTVNRVMVVGHNPGMEELVYDLCNIHEQMPTCATAHFALPIESWVELSEATTGALVNLWRPKELDD